MIQYSASVNLLDYSIAQWKLLLKESLQLDSKSVQEQVMRYQVRHSTLSTLLMRSLQIITTCGFSVYICTDIYPLPQWRLHYSCQKYCYFASVVIILFVIMCHDNYMLATHMNNSRNVLSTPIWGIYFSSDETNLKNLL